MLNSQNRLYPADSGARRRAVRLLQTVYKFKLPLRIPAFLAVFLLFAFFYTTTAKPAPLGNADQPSDQTSAEIVNRYLQATQNHQNSLRGASMEVDISASIPKLKEHGTLRALRKISKLGQTTYHVLGFQGDNTVKNQVIARYLQAEQQGQGDEKLGITPANYKFKLKGERTTNTGEQVYVFHLSPKKKKVGLFKGDLWIDAKDYLPVFEKGRFVKNPSIVFKKVEFERAFTIKNGVLIPQYTTSTIDVRLIGKVKIDINYSNFEQNAEAADADNQADSNGAWSKAK